MANEQDRYKQARIKRLVSEGFHPTEASYYSKVPISTPGMRTIRRVRKKEVQLAKKVGIKNFYKYLHDSYRAQGMVDKQGRVRPEKWHSKIFDELMKPQSERTYLTIPAEKYEIFRKLKMITPTEAAEIVNLVSHKEWGLRRRQYNYLIDNHFSPIEAAKIVYAKDSTGKLQPLNLKHEAWQTVIRERLVWWRNISNQFRKQGFSSLQTFRKAMKEIENYYKRDPKRTPWDNMKLVSPSGPRKPRMDFKDAMRRRKLKVDRYKEQKKKHMPYRAG